MVGRALLGLAVIAQTATGFVTDKWSPLINLGAIGCVLAWFLIRAEPRLGKIERAIDRSSRALMIATLAMRGQDVREEAHDLAKEVDDAAADRDKLI